MLTSDILLYINIRALIPVKKKTKPFISVIIKSVLLPKLSSLGMKNCHVFLFVFGVKNDVLNHLRLHWVLVALHKFSLLVVSGGSSLNCGGWAPHCSGFSCGARAAERMGCGNCGSQA